ncbi:hypothetical protein F5B18DRAFT_440268 [Nemania serpens]|nr:hypothetical protein F5B18DRAFT_440268 [Nemania serpens]
MYTVVLGDEGRRLEHSSVRVLVGRKAGGQALEAGEFNLLYLDQPTDRRADPAWLCWLVRRVLRYIGCNGLGIHIVSHATFCLLALILVRAPSSSFLLVTVGDLNFVLFYNVCLYLCFYFCSYPMLGCWVCVVSLNVMCSWALTAA